jgi:hypothetical protein
VDWAAANDNCAWPTALILGVPASGDTGDSCVNPETVPACLTGNGSGGGLWYSVIGNNHRLRASTCNDADFDTRIRVYTDGCGTLTCVTGNDNQPGCAGNTSWVEWCSESGREYLILVHGTDFAEGSFSLTVTDEGVSCDDGLFCNGADRCSGGSCSLHSGDPCLGGPECNNLCNEALDTCYNPVAYPCGDSHSTDCNGPDACDGAGNCLDNYEPPGTPCTDDGLECTDDECDGYGRCTHPNSPPGTLCGDHGNTDCDNPDSCDGSGTCQDNHEPLGTPCRDDGAFCNGDEYCRNGQCSEHTGFPCATNQWCYEVSERCFDHGNGDFQPDGDVDLEDFAEFQICFMHGISSPCLPANLIGQDETIDLDDFAWFAKLFAGPR